MIDFVNGVVLLSGRWQFCSILVHFLQRFWRILWSSVEASAYLYPQGSDKAYMKRIGSHFGLIHGALLWRFFEGEGHHLLHLL
jgi:hypothetical protein